MDVTGFWRAVLDQDAAAIRRYFAPDAQVRWPCTGERFTVEEFLRANCEYPGDWAGEIQRLERLGDLVITVAHVYTPKDPAVSFHVTSFIQIKGDKITAVDEYWGDDGPAPQWRQDLGLGKKIKEEQP